MKSVAIIGAGIGGLCTGIELLLNGYEVSIYEKNKVPGGVLRTITSPDGAYRFEESASIVINPKTYHKFFKKLGLDPNAYFCDKDLKNLYHVYFHDGRFFYAPHDRKAMETALQKNFAGDVRGWNQFMTATMKKYHISRHYFLNTPFMTVPSVLNPKLLCKLVQLNPFPSASRYVRRFIKSEQLRNFILFQAFYMGIAPNKLPNIYTMVYASSQTEGIRHIQGGLSKYTRVLAQIFEENGGKLYFHSPAEKIQGRGSLASGIQIGDQTIKFDIIVVNADYSYAQKILLGRKLRRNFQLSCSTFIIHLGLTRKYSQLGVHNLFINKYFEEEISRIFKGRLPQNPSLYIYSPSLADDSYCRNPDHSVVNLMLRVPNLKTLPISWDKTTRQRLYKLCLKAVSSIPGLETIEQHIAYKSFTTPVHFKRRYNCRCGSCFGIGHTLFQTMAFRPQIQDKEYKNLYYVGSSIHPGNGASIVMEGAQMASRMICRNHPAKNAGKKRGDRG